MDSSVWDELWLREIRTYIKNSGIPIYPPKLYWGYKRERYIPNIEIILNSQFFYYRVHLYFCHLEYATNILLQVIFSDSLV